ncbi:MAG: FAD-dependent oxidoreductase, partial [Actinomycetota bacterium]|nr:FAD-dependent oxidoreductase [Actinomycetota bacterium]
MGAGLAGATAARTLREEGFDGRIVLVGDEPQAPYERPPLSKSYLLGKSALADARVDLDGQDVELIPGALATGLDPVARVLSLADSRSLRYDRLLIATGAVP